MPSAARKQGERKGEKRERKRKEQEGGKAGEKHAHVRVASKSPGRPSQMANPGSHMHGPKHTEADEGKERGATKEETALEISEYLHWVHITRQQECVKRWWPLGPSPTKRTTQAGRRLLTKRIGIPGWAAARRAAPSPHATTRPRRHGEFSEARRSASGAPGGDRREAAGRGREKQGPRRREERKITNYPCALIPLPEKAASLALHAVASFFTAAAIVSLVLLTVELLV